MKRDRVVILMILGLALAATLFAGWFRWSQGHLAKAYWGVEVAQRIRFAPQVELIWLGSPVYSMPPRPGLSQRAPVDSIKDDMTIDGTLWTILKRADITQAPGLVHLRQSLIQDATFLWDEPMLGPDSAWSHALVIRGDDGEAVTLLFDLDAATEGFIREQDSQEKIRLTIPQGFKTFFSEQGAPESSWP